MTSAWPSGALLATKSAPIFPPAPGLLSTITAWPRACCSFAASSRAETSTGPPAAYGTTRWTGLEGQVWAAAGRLAASSAPRKTRRRTVLLCVFYERLVALLADRGQHDDHQQDRRGDHEAEADRLGEEGHRIAARQQHRAAQVLFHQRPQDEAQDQRR